MKVFSNCIVVVEFEPSTSYKEKSSWKKSIVDNGGVISYILTKKASFFVVFNKKGASVSFKLKQCARYNIPVVSPKYVEQCVAKNRLLDTVKYRVKELTNNHEFGKGKIQTSAGRQSRVTKKKHVSVNISTHPCWLFGDVNAPEFDENAFELPKWSLLINEDQSKVVAIEIHVSTRQGQDFKYRLYTQSAFLENKKVIQTDDAIVWYFLTCSEVLSSYDQLYRQYTNKPVCMSTCEPGVIDVENLGSASLKMALGRVSLQNESISHKVAALTSLIWNEALTEVDNMLVTQMKYIKEKQINEARVILAQLCEKLISNRVNIDDDVKPLIDQFYEVLPHQDQFQSNNWTLRDVVGKQDLCQLLSDIVSVSEATDWSFDTTVIAKYRAMACHIQHLKLSGNDITQNDDVINNNYDITKMDNDVTNIDDDDFTRLQDAMQQEFSEKGGKLYAIYRVRRTVEEVNFESDVGNVKLLTHASPSYNLLGILSRGLILPNTVTDKFGVSRTDAGNLGSGIYFSDNPRKSSQYSTQNVQTGTRFMFLCDVALGQSHQVYQSDSSLTAAPEGSDSVHGVKATEENPSEFTENEYVIYNPNQQCIRYLVEFSLPGDDIKDTSGDINVPEENERESGESKHTKKDSSPSQTNIDISDVKDILDPLAKVKPGLQGNKDEHIPLKSVHIRGRMLDMVAQVVVLQAYKNDNDKSIEAKYVFPLDQTAAVCGFEAFINGKHIIGEVKEKSKARKEYKEAVARGDGAYLMEEETPDVFSVSVGNLPPRADVLIKITYISELQVQGEAIVFNIPASVAPWLRDGALANQTQTSTKSVKVSSHRRCEVSLMVAMEMPFDIRNIHSPSHRIKCKKTATKAVISLPRKSSLEEGFQVQVFLAEVHVPRMWVEKHPKYNTQACMLTFYPEFESESLTEPDILILLDMSNSMKGEAEEHAKKVALLSMDFLPPSCRFNIAVFGSTHRELFPTAQKYNSIACELGKQFIQESKALLGSTELWNPIHTTQILTSADKTFQSLFLISDGHVTQESVVLEAVKKTAEKIRIFTLGVSSTVNHHVLRSIARNSGGTYEHYNKDSKSQWQGKLLSQLEKTTQPGLTDVYVDWLQTNENATPPTQAPNYIPCLFSGCRQVVYGFVESCSQATLRAKVNGNDVSTMVSTVDLNCTSGTMLHQLVARAVIRDFEDGCLHDDYIKHQVLKGERKQYVIDLSKQHSIVTPYTSFVAIEDRQQVVDEVSIIPSITDLISRETVDILPYIDWEPGIDEKDEDPLSCVRELLKKGELQESYSMIQAEETYTTLVDYIEDIKLDMDTLDTVYQKLSKFYQQNHAEMIGNILSEIEELRVNNQMERLEALKSYDFEEYLAQKISLRDDMLSKKHMKKAVQWLNENGWSHPNDIGRNSKLNADYVMEQYGDIEEQEFEGTVEMVSLMPPEIVISPEEIASMEVSLAAASDIPLPDDFDSLEDEPERASDKRQNAAAYCNQEKFFSSIHKGVNKEHPSESLNDLKQFENVTQNIYDPRKYPTGVSKVTTPAKPSSKKGALKILYKNVEAESNIEGRIEEASSATINTSTDGKNYCRRMGLGLGKGGMRTKKISKNVEAVSNIEGRIEEANSATINACTDGKNNYKRIGLDIDRLRCKKIPQGLSSSSAKNAEQQQQIKEDILETKSISPRIGRKAQTARKSTGGKAYRNTGYVASVTDSIFDECRESFDNDDSDSIVDMEEEIRTESVVSNGNQRETDVVLPDCQEEEIFTAEKLPFTSIERINTQPGYIQSGYGYCGVPLDINEDIDCNQTPQRAGPPINDLLQSNITAMQGPSRCVTSYNESVVAAESNYISPAYSPTSPSYSPVSPYYNPSMPVYMPLSPISEFVSALGVASNNYNQDDNKKLVCPSTDDFKRYKFKASSRPDMSISGPVQCTMSSATPNISTLHELKELNGSLDPYRPVDNYQAPAAPDKNICSDNYSKAIQNSTSVFSRSQLIDDLQESNHSNSHLEVKETQEVQINNFPETETLNIASGHTQRSQLAARRKRKCIMKPNSIGYGKENETANISTIRDRPVTMMMSLTGIDNTVLPLPKRLPKRKKKSRSRDRDIMCELNIRRRNRRANIRNRSRSTSYDRLLQQDSSSRHRSYRRSVSRTRSPIYRGRRSRTYSRSLSRTRSPIYRGRRSRTYSRSLSRTRSPIYRGRRSRTYSRSLSRTGSPTYFGRRSRTYSRSLSRTRSPIYRGRRSRTYSRSLSRTRSPINRGRRSRTYSRSLSRESSPFHRRQRVRSSSRRSSISYSPVKRRSSRSKSVSRTRSRETGRANHRSRPRYRDESRNRIYDYNRRSRSFVRDRSKYRGRRRPDSNSMKDQDCKHRSRFRNRRYRSRSLSSGRDISRKRRRSQSFPSRSQIDDVGFKCNLEIYQHQLDAPLISDVSSLWKGVRAGNHVENLHRKSNISDLLQVCQDSSTTDKTCYFEMSDALCSLLDIDKARMMQILINQGVKSLGCSTECRVRRVIATLLALLVYVKQYVKGSSKEKILKHLKPDSTVTYLLQDDELLIIVDGKTLSVKRCRGRGVDLTPVVRWLEMQYKELPPLYNSLELGKTKMEFLFQLALIYNDI